MIGSCHYIRLAADLNLFVGGLWIQQRSAEWEAIGAYWKTLDPNARWGGDFQTVDLNHFSFAYQGRS